MEESLLKWVKVKKVKPKRKRKRRPTRMYRFEMTFKEGLMTPKGPSAPFHKGDIVSEGALPRKMWRVLVERGAVTPIWTWKDEDKRGVVTPMWRWKDEEGRIQGV